jgi:P4 family phage/plasmid primase-like protien
MTKIHSSKDIYNWDLIDDLVSVLKLIQKNLNVHLYDPHIFEELQFDVDISNNETWIDLSEKRKKVYYEIACKCIKKGKQNVINELNNSIDIVKENQNQKIIELIQSGLNINSVYQNVQYLHQIHPFCYDKGKFFYFWEKDNCLWFEVDEIDVMNAIDQKLKLTGQTTKSYVINEYVNVVKRIGRENQPKELPPEMIQFQNKIFNIKTKKIIDATPEFFHINSIPHKIGESDKTPLIDKIITEWVGEENLQLAKEIMAYCCYNDYSIHRIFVFIGGGSNGKSTFMQLIENFIGKKNICSTSLDALIENRFETFSLYGKKVASVGETNFGLLERTDLIKKLSGNDIVKFEAKNKGAFEGRNTAKLIVSSNSLPTSDDRSDGFYRRFLILDFPNQFKEKVDLLKNIPEEEYCNLANWCVNNLPLILERGGFSGEGDIEERKQKYILSSNPLPIFLERCCIVNPDDSLAFVSAAELYQLYVQALSKAKKRIVHRKEFIKSMTDAGFRYEKINRSLETGGYFNGWAIIGIEINKEAIKTMENIFVTKMPKMTKVAITPSIIYSNVNLSENCHNRHKIRNEIYNLVYQYGKEGAPLTDMLNTCDNDLVTKLLSEGAIFESPKGKIKTNWTPTNEQLLSDNESIKYINNKK